MAGKWSIVENKRLQNLISNPSLERDTSGWAVTGGTFTRVTAQQTSGLPYETIYPYSGSWMGYFQPGASTDCLETPLWDFSAVDSNRTASTIRLYTESTGGVSVYYASSTAAATTDEIFVGTVVETRVWTPVSYSSVLNSGIFRLYGTCYVDAMQSYGFTDTRFTSDNPVSDHEFTYIDGDSHLCFWTGAPHNSPSVAPYEARVYGEIVSLDDYSMHVVETNGAGMALVENTFADIAQQPGGVYTGQDVPVREESNTAEIDGATSLPDLHSKRKDLIDLMKLDRTPGDRPFRVVYTGAHASRKIYQDCYLAGGLEYNRSAESGFNETVVCRFQAPDPFWYEFGGLSHGLGYYQSTTSGVSIVSVNDYPESTSPGAKFFAGLNGPVYDLSIDEYTGRLYACGDFTSDGTSTLNRIAYRSLASSDTWQALGAGADGLVFAVTVDANSDVYAAGDFSTAAASSDALYVAKWTWDSSSWGTVGTGLTGGLCRDLDIGHDGFLYATGSFTSAGGVAGTNGIARWTGAAWEALGSTGITGGQGNSICVDTNGDIYIGGSFTVIDGVSCSNVAKFNYSSSSFEALGSGANSYLSSVVCDAQGSMYAGGTFTTAGGDTDCVHIARWNGSEWIPLQNGLANIVLRLGSLGSRLFIGQFAQQNIYEWNGYSYGTAQVGLESITGKSVLSIAASDKYGVVLFGLDNVSPLVSAGVATNVDATNTRKGKPVFKIRSIDGNVRIIQIKNEMTGDTIYSNYTAMQGEQITIDCRDGTMVSSQFGNVAGRGILRGSKFTTFEMYPSENILTAYIDSTGTTNVEFTVEWQNRHWSLDGAAS